MIQLIMSTSNNSKVYNLDFSKTEVKEPLLIKNTKKFKQLV